MEQDDFVFNIGSVAQETNFYGVKYDFNYGARVFIPPGKEMRVKITDLDTNTILFDTMAENAIVSSNKKYFINYRIEVWNDDHHFQHDLELKGKKVVIVCPTRAIGDVIAWVPYAEEFKRVHECNVSIYIGPHMRDLMKNNYPDLDFLDSTDFPKDAYATYVLGVFFPVTDRDRQPIDFRLLGLQKTVACILNLSPCEIKAHIKATSDRVIKEPYVCIAVQSTTQCKTWNNQQGWIEVVDYLKSIGYRVLCIDKDKSYSMGRLTNSIPYGCEDFTGNIPLQERVNLLTYADFFVGVSSGLSWLAWACNIPVVMIGGFTLPFNEFSNPYRVINYNTCTGCWHEVEFNNKDYGWCPRHQNTDREFECSRLISSKQVINTVNKLISDIKNSKE